MDADVMITVAFGLEVLLFALAGGLFVTHEFRKSRSEAAAAAGQLVTARERRAVRGLRS